MEIRETRPMVSKCTDQFISLINEVAQCEPPDPMKTHHSAWFIMHRNTNKIQNLEGPHVTLSLVQFEFWREGRVVAWEDDRTTMGGGRFLEKCKQLQNGKLKRAKLLRISWRVRWWDPKLFMNNQQCKSKLVLKWNPRLQIKIKCYLSHKNAIKWYIDHQERISNNMASRNSWFGSSWIPLKDHSNGWL